ncbi:MAG: HD domain-containing protein, partial [Coriobacteriales bacterium]
KWASKVIGRYVDVILVLIPEMEPMIGLDTHSELHIYDVWEHTLVALENQRSNDPVTRMATLFHDTGKTIVNDPTKGAFRFAGHAEASGKICRQVLRRLKFPRKFIDECSLVISSHDLRFEDTNYSVRKWMGELGAETFFRVVDLKRADICAHNPEIARDAVAKMDRIRECAQQALDNGDCYKVSDLEISGADLMEIGFEKGPEIGETLTWILDEVMRGVCDNDKDKLLELARARLLTSGRNQGD